MELVVVGGAVVVGGLVVVVGGGFLVVGVVGFTPGFAGAVVGVVGGGTAMRVLETTCAGFPPNTYTGSPRWMRVWKYSAMCIGIRVQPCDAGSGGTDEYPCTAIPPLK